MQKDLTLICEKDVFINVKNALNSLHFLAASYISFV